eukprot:150550_1
MGNNKSSNELKTTIKENQSQIDFKVLKQNNQKCDFQSNAASNDILSNCSHLARITNALKYNEYLFKNFNISDTAKTFTEFIQKKYKMCLEDYIHFMCVHSQHYKSIAQELNANHGIFCDDINSCKQIERHYRDRNEERVAGNNKYSMYSELFNSIHCYLFHLEHLCLRSSLSQPGVINKLLSDNELADLIDKEFNAISQTIYQKRKENTSFFNRIDNINKSKFVIKQTGHDIDIDHDYDDESNITNTCTFIDHMLNYIADRDEPDGAIVQILKGRISAESYDTDSIADHIDTFADGMNNQHIQLLLTFIKHYNLARNSLSTGFVFWYHEYYKNINDEQIKQESWLSGLDDNNFDGNSVRDLYVEKIYNSFKEEALSSNWIEISQFDEEIIAKGNKYIKTSKCKKIRCIYGGALSEEDPLHYNIAFGTCISASHLYSVIIYCNFSDFCTEYRKSFRKLKWDETMQSVKKRNSKYFYISKYLREVVQYFGTTYNYTINGFEGGPFFTGLSFCMNIGYFSIRLNAPTSTSKEKTVAHRFTKGTGIILQLNNNKYPGCDEAFFNASWVSCFPEEEERIWFGGQYRLELETIIDVKTCNNYQQIVQAIYKLDSILSGQSAGQSDFDNVNESEKKSNKKSNITSVDVNIVNALIQYSLNSYYTDKIMQKLDSYIKDNFLLFRISKTQIILNLQEMIYVKHQFTDLIHYPIHKNVNCKIMDAESNDNVFRPIIVDLFPN